MSSAPRKTILVTGCAGYIGALLPRCVAVRGVTDSRFSRFPHCALLPALGRLPRRDDRQVSRPRPARRPPLIPTPAQLLQLLPHRVDPSLQHRHSRAPLHRDRRRQGGLHHRPLPRRHHRQSRHRKGLCRLREQGRNLRSYPRRCAQGRRGVCREAPPVLREQHQRYRQPPAGSCPLLALSYRDL